MFWMNGKVEATKNNTELYEQKLRRNLRAAEENIDGTRNEISKASAYVSKKENKLLLALKTGQILKLAGDNCYVYKTSKGFVYFYGKPDFNKPLNQQKNLRIVGPYEKGDIASCALNTSDIFRGASTLITSTPDSLKKLIATKFHSIKSDIQNTFGDSFKSQNFLHMSEVDQHGRHREATKKEGADNALETDTGRTLTNYGGNDIAEMNSTISHIKFNKFLSQILKPTEVAQFMKASDLLFTKLQKPEEFEAKDFLTYHVPDALEIIKQSDTDAKLNFAKAIGESIKDPSKGAPISQSLANMKGKTTYCTELLYLRILAGFTATLKSEDPRLQIVEGYKNNRYKTGPMLIELFVKLGEASPGKPSIEIESGHTKYHENIFNEMKASPSVVKLFEGSENHFETVKFLDVDALNGSVAKR